MDTVASTPLKAASFVLSVFGFISFSTSACLRSLHFYKSTLIAQLVKANLPYVLKKLEAWEQTP